MADDVFGHPLDDVSPDDPGETPETEGTAEDGTDAETTDSSPDELQATGDEPTDPAQQKKYWQGAYTKSRQKDRERYGTLEQEHRQYKQLLANFYQDDAYAMQVLRQRFPQLASQLQQPPQGQGTTTSPTTGASSGLAERLKQRLGEFGFLADGLGQALEEEIQARVEQRVQPLEQRSIQQTEQTRHAEETRLLTAMDAKYPGWEESVGAKMQALDDFLGSDALTHPEFGNKYELYYRLLNPDATRREAIHAMGDAAKRRTGLSRTGRSSAPNVADLVRKAENNASAFEAAAKAALEELG